MVAGPKVDSASTVSEAPSAKRKVSDPRTPGRMRTDSAGRVAGQPMYEFDEYLELALQSRIARGSLCLLWKF